MGVNKKDRFFMIELYNLTKTQRTELARTAESFFLAYKKTKQLMSAYNNIADHLTPKQVEKFDAEIWTLISATSQCVRHDSNACQFSFQKQNYTTANEITKKKIDCSRMVALVHILEGHALLTKYKGFHLAKSTARGIDKAMRSILLFSDTWLNMFDVAVCKRFGTARCYDLVFLRDADKNNLSTKGLRGVGQEKKLLKEWNTLLESANITIAKQPAIVVYTTVFNESLKLGGRLYAGSFSTEAAELRPTIEIYGNPTCEIDYKNNHFRILYNEKGVDYQRDAYEMPCPSGWDAKTLRTIAKFAALMMLNADSKQSARKALYKKLSGQKYYNAKGEEVTRKSKYITHTEWVFEGVPRSYETVDYVMSELEDLHTPITNHFYKAEWDRLQNIDSRMAKQVVKAFLVLGIPVLTYHDSFVCESKHKDLLIKTMQEAWEIVLGDSKGFDYDVEFCNEPEQPPVQTSNEYNVQLEMPTEIIPLAAYNDVSLSNEYKDIDLALEQPEQVPVSDFESVIGHLDVSVPVHVYAGVSGDTERCNNPQHVQQSLSEFDSLDSYFLSQFDEPSPFDEPEHFPF